MKRNQLRNEPSNMNTFSVSECGLPAGLLPLVELSNIDSGLLKDSSLKYVLLEGRIFKKNLLKKKLPESYLLKKAGSTPKSQELNWPVFQRAISPSDYQDFNISNQTHKFALPVTFTPYASAKPCSARCWFCSENLATEGASARAARLRPGSDYQRQLADALKQLTEVPMGLSLSGLELTDDIEWLQSTLNTLDNWSRNGGQWQEKAAYTNAAGLANQSTQLALINRLAEFGLDRIEVSRHHLDSVINQKIMNFRSDESIQHNKVFEQTLVAMTEQLPVSLVCIIQEGGIATMEQVEQYISWARTLGVNKIIFRELCDVPNNYKNNKTFKMIKMARCQIEPLVEGFLKKEKAHFNFFVNGYYFWNANFEYQNLEIIFERSDYQMMNEEHYSEVIHKLVFFANGNLCAGWQPDERIIYSAGEL